MGCNSSIKIQCRLDYFFISMQLKDHLKECKNLSNTNSDHSAIALSQFFNKKGVLEVLVKNSLLLDTNYVELHDNI